MAKKLKNKTPGTYFFTLPTTMQLPKDLLALIFWELESGHDMINFSELNRRSQQIFRQSVNICCTWPGIRKTKKMKTKQGLIHGICRGWYPNEQLWYEYNYCHGKRHGLARSWYSNGQLECEYNFRRGIIHGPSRGWYSTGKIIN